MKSRGCFNEFWAILRWFSASELACFGLSLGMDGIIVNGGFSARAGPYLPPEREKATLVEFVKFVIRKAIANIGLVDSRYS